MKKFARETIEASVERLELIATLLRLTAEQEQERYDKWSEKTQEGERGEMLTDRIDCLNSAADLLDDAISNIIDALDYEV